MSAESDADVVRELRALAEAEPRLRPLIDVIIERVISLPTSRTRYIGITEVEKRVGLERSTLYRKYRATPPAFPRPEYRGERRVWRLDVIQAWEREQLARPRKPRLRGFAARLTAVQR